jgi:hypothetical protein
MPALPKQGTGGGGMSEHGPGPFRLTDLSELDMMLLYNGLMLFHGDFPQSYMGSTIWQRETESVMAKFPADFQRIKKVEEDAAERDEDRPTDADGQAERDHKQETYKAMK